MVVKYRQTIGRLADEKQKIFDNLYKVYNAIHNTEFAADLKHKHAAVLAVLALTNLKSSACTKSTPNPKPMRLLLRRTRKLRN